MLHTEGKILEAPTIGINLFLTFKASEILPLNALSLAI